MMRGRHKQGALPTNGMRSMWEFVFVAQFLRVFQGKFGFVNFTAEELENAFLESKSSVLLAIFCDLLRILLPKQDIKISTWQEVLKEEFENRSSNWRPFEEGKRYETFSAEERVLLLKHLIDYLTDGEDKELKEFATDFLNPNSTKVKPVGHDANNNIYWYFDDRRLYREIIGKKGHRTGWETVCLNYQDWNKLLSTFQKSTNSNEKRLYKYLKNELFPAVMPSAKEDEKEKELVTLNKDRLPKVQDQTTSKHKTEKYAVVTQVDDKVGKKRSKQSEASPNGSTEEEELEEEDLEEEDEEDTAEEEEEDHDLDDNSEADEEFDPEDEEDSPPPKKKRKPPPALPQVGQRKRGRPAGSSRTGALDQQKAGEKKRKRSTQNQEQIEKDMQRRRRLKKLAEEQKKKDQTFMTEEEAKPVHTTNKETKTESLDNADLPSDLKDMTLVGNRVRTYMYWPSTSSVNVFELARAGFVFTGVDDVVKCFQCKGTLKMWKPGDDPMDGHREYYPDCPHVMALDALKRPVNTLTQLDDLSTVCQGVGHRLKQLCSLQSKASGVEPAKKHLTELQKRLDTTERTMHLVMKQMEAVTKCLAKTLADDPATSDDKSLAEITKGLVNLKESNV